jgi:hypothetical protein
VRLRANVIATVIAVLALAAAACSSGEPAPPAADGETGSPAAANAQPVALRKLVSDPASHADAAVEVEGIFVGTTDGSYLAVRDTGAYPPAQTDAVYLALGPGTYDPLTQQPCMKENADLAIVTTTGRVTATGVFRYDEAAPFGPFGDWKAEIEAPAVECA